MTKTAAFSELGTVCKNPRWSWSGQSPDGKIVALTFWQDKLLKNQNAMLDYNDTAWKSPKVASRPGNKERMKDIQHAIEHLSSVVHVVVAIAKDPDADPREIQEAFARPDILMKITYFDDVTGEWCAEQITDK
jgi:hypothetical protein